jgi:hypothetical protein
MSQPYYTKIKIHILKKWCTHTFHQDLHFTPLHYAYIHFTAPPALLLHYTSLHYIYVFLLLPTTKRIFVQRLVIMKLICKLTARNMYIKYTNAQQQKLYSFTNTKKKLLKTNAAIWSNNIHRNHQLTPKYSNIMVNGNNKQSQNT